ncbi:uncharacterized protein AB675_4946 [Cyphellophora attinorum]|uniref:Uncharacterized protein n=1 Tax=Cyphellophora attinorum TaxID=1664694 RepID=A0A0N1NV65_9EURO|nr:uncharacterized protein AB675_4946 [Phialophora attinorum]KPI34280.1 hypothetical protein AB675_4946 [Phialophora attinorum]
MPSEPTTTNQCEAGNKELGGMLNLSTGLNTPAPVRQETPTKSPFKTTVRTKRFGTPFTEEEEETPVVKRLNDDEAEDALEQATTLSTLLHSKSMTVTAAAALGVEAPHSRPEKHATSVATIKRRITPKVPLDSEEADLGEQYKQGLPEKGPVHEQCFRRFEQWDIYEASAGTRRRRDAGR